VCSSREYKNEQESHLWVQSESIKMSSSPIPRSYPLTRRHTWAGHKDWLSIDQTYRLDAWWGGVATCKHAAYCLWRKWNKEWPTTSIYTHSTDSNMVPHIVPNRRQVRIKYKICVNLHSYRSLELRAPCQIRETACSGLTAPDNMQALLVDTIS